MGQGFMVWAVDTNKLRQAAGSKDEKLRRMIGGRFKLDNGAVYPWSSPDFAPVNAVLKKLGVPFEAKGEEAAIVECVRGWFRDAAAQGRGLVSYYH